jgi:beta-lactam-binding protein with PASTA domain
VPDIVGLMRSPAVSKLEARGYSAHVTVLYSSDKPRGVVFEQVPSAGWFADRARL